jgi:hypothetical protein
MESHWRFLPLDRHLAISGPIVARTALPNSSMPTLLGHVPLQLGQRTPLHQPGPGNPGLDPSAPKKSRPALEFEFRPLEQRAGCGKGQSRADEHGGAEVVALAGEVPCCRGNLGALGLGERGGEC